MKKLFAAVAATLLTANLAIGAQDTIHVPAGPPAWGTNVGLAPLYTIGGPPDYIVGNLYTRAVDRFNRVYLVDGTARVLNSFDANGKFLRTIGRWGSGPGEYRQPAGLTIIQDSLIMVWDPANARLTVFQPSGKLERSITLTRPLIVNGSLVVDSANHVYLQSRFIRGPDGRSENLPPTQIQWLRISPEGKIVDSIREPQFHESTEGLFYAAPLGGANFAPQSSVRPSPIGGLVFGIGDRYRFAIRPLRGPVRVVERDWTPVQVGSEERAQWTALADAMSQRDPKHPSYDIPKTKPAYSYLWVDRDGRIWVGLYAPANKRDLPPRTTTPGMLPRIEWLQDQVHDVFDPMGKYLGRVALPWNTMDFVAAHDDRLWLRSRGPDAEDLVTAYKLTGIKGH